MATIQGFKIMRAAFDESVKSSHFMYFKKHIHQKQSQLTPSNRTIFVANVPPYCTKIGLENLFGNFGPIKAIFIQDAPGPVQDTQDNNANMKFSIENFCFKVAYIVFKNPNSVEELMKSELTDVCYMSQKKKRIKSGLEKWCMEYGNKYPNPKEVQEKVNKFMAKFDQKEAEEKAKMERLANEPDEDGWTVVSHGKKNVGAEVERVTEKERKRRKKKELANFYTFQQRESKREHIATLRKKFEEDKKKIQQLRAARKFKPF